MNYKSFCLSCFVFLACTSCVIAQERRHPDADFLIVDIGLDEERVDPLKEVVDIGFGPRGAGMTIGDAAVEVLLPTGWRLARPSLSNNPAAMRILLGRPLARVHCELGVCQIEQFLQAVAWPCFEVNRAYISATITFDQINPPGYRCGQTQPPAPVSAAQKPVITKPRLPVRRVVYHNPIWSLR